MNRHSDWFCNSQGTKNNVVFKHVQIICVSPVVCLFFCVFVADCCLSCFFVVFYICFFFVFFFGWNQICWFLELAQSWHLGGVNCPMVIVVPFPDRVVGALPNGLNTDLDDPPSIGGPWNFPWYNLAGANCDEQLWATDDRFPTKFSEQMSNSVGVKHLPVIHVTYQN